MSYVQVHDIKKKWSTVVRRVHNPVGDSHLEFESWHKGEKVAFSVAPILDTLAIVLNEGSAKGMRDAVDNAELVILVNGHVEISTCFPDNKLGGALWDGDDNLIATFHFGKAVRFL